MEETMDLCMDLVGIPVAFPPEVGDEAREYLLDKLEEPRVFFEETCDVSLVGSKA